MAEEDFGFYGEEAEEDKVEEIQGITENVSEFTYSSLEYPCIMFKDGFSLKNHKWKVLSNMVNLSLRIRILVYTSTITESCLRLERLVVLR